MKLLYGTGNPAKLKIMREYLIGLDVEVIGLNDVRGPVPKVEENGVSPAENAEIKARAYFDAWGIPVFSCDSGLYFDELPEEQQPGLFVRRAPDGHEMSDEEMTAHYAALAAEHGGRLTARYRNAICFIPDAERVFRRMDDSLAGEKFFLGDRPHTRREKGFPLDCLSIDIETGAYYYDLPVGEISNSNMRFGFRAFFEAALRVLNGESDAEKENLFF